MKCPSKEEIARIIFEMIAENNTIEHLKQCENCLEIFNEYKKLWNDLSQLQNIKLITKPADFRLNLNKITNKKRTLTKYFVSPAFYLIILTFLTAFIYLYKKISLKPSLKSANYNTFFVSIYKLSDEKLIKKYENNLKKILHLSNEKRWFSKSIEGILTNYRNKINTTYKEYFPHFIEKLESYSNGDFTNIFKNLYEATIFFYYLSQELKIKKFTTGTITQQNIKILNSIMDYLDTSQNSDGGFGIFPSDQKSIPQILFWVSLFIRNYVILTGKIPVNIINKIKNYIKTEKNPIFEFSKIFLFEEKPILKIDNYELIYIEQILSFQFIHNIENLIKLTTIQPLSEDSKQFEIFIFI